MNFKSLAHVAEVYRVQLKNNWVREAVYRTNFLTAVVTDLIWIVIEFSLFTVIYANVTSLAGWTNAAGLLLPRNLLRFGCALHDFLPTQLLEFLGSREQGRTRHPPHQTRSRRSFWSLSRWMNLTACFNIVLGRRNHGRTTAPPPDSQAAGNGCSSCFWLLVGVDRRDSGSFRIFNLGFLDGSQLGHFSPVLPVLRLRHEARLASIRASSGTSSSPPSHLASSEASPHARFFRTDSRNTSCSWASSSSLPSSMS